MQRSTVIASPWINSITIPSAPESHLRRGVSVIQFDVDRSLPGTYQRLSRDSVTSKKRKQLDLHRLYYLLPDSFRAHLPQYVSTLLSNDLFVTTRRKHSRVHYKTVGRRKHVNP